ncbi:Lipid II flippase FtsW [Corynebacterium urogenitale]|uniref:Probable peptidoglycan glycosyltransferase FtsW n=1 Tax=Corynebacterium urogenitale TaxID=2487892 RepID=A0A5J6Z9Z0_9CORY|nr:putative lipid II flippase FtsW [Corynebacterium urogenitale]QFQ02149.1 Lipid II flippase FtsW [Corynebacterium urogenitale]
MTTRQASNTPNPRGTHKGASQSQPARGDQGSSPWKTLAGRVQELLSKPQTNYVVIFTVTILLAALGLVMVFSSSMVTSRASGGSVYSEFLRQSVIVVVGFIGMWFAMWIRPQTIRRLSPYLLLVGVGLLLAVLIPGVGVGGDEVGSNSWIRFGGVGIQPSEVGKLALAVWGSASVAQKLNQSRDAKTVLGPMVAVGGGILFLVLMQKDLGMMMSLGVVLLALVFFAGVNTRSFSLLLGAVTVVGAIAILSQGYRSARITTWTEALLLRFQDGSTKGDAYQSYQGILSLSDGGLTGLGLGQSRAKWFYLPEATNDFIFAVIGEELGFLGALLVVTLFALLGWFGIRTALAHTDPFMRMLAATLTLGIVVQAFINMGYVVGYLPVTGIQLPLISAGGSSAVITLVTTGLLANCARHEPNAVSSMQHEGRPLIDRILLLPEPQPIVAGSERREARRTTAHRYGEPVTRRRGSAGRAGQDVRRERDRLEESKRRAGTEAMERDYDGRRRSSLPPVRDTRRSTPRGQGRTAGRSLNSSRTHRPDTRRR